VPKPDSLIENASGAVEEFFSKWCTLGIWWREKVHIGQKAPMRLPGY